MIYLDRVYQDGMVLQRQKPILFRGISDRAQSLTLRVEGQTVGTADVGEGRFELSFPPQEAAEDVTIGIGEVILRHVDIGEVWIGGGQSNMEFMLKFEEHGEEEVAAANDPHIRTYVVGQYSIEGERQDGFADWKAWDRWLPFTPEYAGDLPAPAIFFAQELRKQGVPVGILACNWGGTNAATWTDINLLEQDEELKVYIEDFDGIVAGIKDMDRYQMLNRISRMGTNMKTSSAPMDFIMKSTYHPDDLAKAIASFMSPDAVSNATNEEGKEQATAMGELPGGITPEEMMMIGPNDKNAPGRLYETMLQEIKGYTVRGVLWYQGESDVDHADIYDRLFSTMIGCWRRDWGEELPFLFVQLAPYGVWMMNTSEKYPMLRENQEKVAHTVPGVYMASISDIGNVYDIHPKQKKAVGHRLWLLAQKYIYGEPEVEADAPEAADVTVEQDQIRISFVNGQGLHMDEIDLTSYNGFPLERISEELRPPVLAGVCGLQVWLDGVQLMDESSDVRCEVKQDQLVITAPKAAAAKEIRIAFARTGFYKVHIFNRAGLPVKPFEKLWTR